MIEPGWNDELAAIAAAQFGVVTTAQALAAGYSERQVRTRTREGGPWIAVRRGAYTLRSFWDTQSHDDKCWLRDVAAHLTMVTPHVLSHDSAGRGLGLPLLRSRPALSHISRPGVGGTRTEHGVMHHLARVPPASVVVSQGIPMTGLARTSLDITRERGFPAGVVAIDAALRRGAQEREYARELVLMRHWPFITVSRAALRFSDPGAENPAESLARILVAELDIGPVTTQFAVDRGDSIAWCDLQVGPLVIEVDGRVKYLHPDRGGVADASVEEVLWREKLRERDVCAAGLAMARLFWDDFFGAGRERAKARLMDEYLRAVARYGATLPDHLEEFARLHPRPIPPLPVSRGATVAEGA